MKNKVVLLLSTLVIFSPLSLAKAPNIKEDVKAQPKSTMSNLAVAKQLGQIGMAQKDPLLLISAAKLYKMTAIEEKKLERKSQGGEKSEKESVSLNSAEALLEAATDLSGDNKAYIAMIKEVEGLKTRGKMGGSEIHYDTIDAKGMHEYVIDYYGDEIAELLIVGDGDTDLDLRVFDEYGNLVCEDADYSDTMYCAWVPILNGPFVIEVTNHGRVYNEYAIISN